MKSKKTNFGHKDMISGLPEALICHILSFLPIEDSALTSVLSKKWRYLFVYRPNLDFYGSVLYQQHPPAVLYDHIERAPMIHWDFIDFVDRVWSCKGLLLSTSSLLLGNVVLFVRIMSRNGY